MVSVAAGNFAAGVGVWRWARGTSVPSFSARHSGVSPRLHPRPPPTPSLDLALGLACLQVFQPGSTTPAAQLWDARELLDEESPRCDKLLRAIQARGAQHSTAPPPPPLPCPACPRADSRTAYSAGLWNLAHSHAVPAPVPLPLLMHHASCRCICPRPTQTSATHSCAMPAPQKVTLVAACTAPHPAPRATPFPFFSASHPHLPSALCRTPGRTSCLPPCALAPRQPGTTCHRHASAPCCAPPRTAGPSARPPLRRSSCTARPAGCACSTR